MVMVGVLLAASTQVAALEPAGSWVVDYRDQGCTLARSFGSGADTVAVAWRVLPIGDKAQFIVSRHARDDGLQRSVATLALAGGGTQESPFEAFSYGDRTTRRQQFQVTTTMFRDAPSDTVLTITPALGPAVSLKTTALAKAWKAVDACRASVLGSWGKDPVRLANVVTPPRFVDPHGWIRWTDYPVAALAKGQMGTTAIAWTVGVDGSVEDCHVTISSGSPDLDDAVCRALIGRARFIPGRDAAGKPVPAMLTRQIVWLMPGQGWKDDNAYVRYQEKLRRDDLASDGGAPKP
ncbi:energy transducer TonB [Sphingomonas adhaesiva]|uniref:energy transducer TonB n=1 Tax=Sphingomonas adhaesiva TaxID=28212 RepID=UPI002FF60DA0